MIGARVDDAQLYLPRVVSPEYGSMTISHATNDTRHLFEISLVQLRTLMKFDVVRFYAGCFQCIHAFELRLFIDSLIERGQHPRQTLWL